MPTHRLCSQVEWTLRMESCRQGHHGPCWAPVSLRRPGYEGTPKIWHIEAAHQMLVKRNEGGRLLKATVLCGGTILFYFSWLKIENFKNKKFQNVSIYIMSPYSISSTTEDNIFLNTKWHFLTAFPLLSCPGSYPCGFDNISTLFWLYYFSLVCFWQKCVVVIHPLC